MTRGRQITLAKNGEKRCETCRFLRIHEDRTTACGHHRLLDPVNCPEYQDAAHESRQNPEYGTFGLRGVR